MERSVVAATATAVPYLLCIFLLFSAAKALINFTGEPNLYRQSPANSLCAQLIVPSGYPCEEHTIETKDGYLLGLQRVSSRSGSLRGERGFPVLLQHGLFMSGDAWFLDSIDQSLGFILADHGFDVWVGNVRGTRWSHGHTSLSEKDKEFWDWSWEELALYDLAEMIHSVNLATKSKIFVVGHSQGTIMSLAAFTRPDIVKMVEAAALLCPISYLEHVSAPFVHRIVNIHLDQVILAMGIHQLNFKSDVGAHILDSVCDGHVDCSDLLSSITGCYKIPDPHVIHSGGSTKPVSAAEAAINWQSANVQDTEEGENCCFNDSRVEFYLEYEPHPSSSKNLNHLFQSRFFTVIRKGTFAQYDYGFWKNRKQYGQSKPPEFDLSLIPESLPLWMAYGGKDALADVMDVEHTLKELQSKPELLYLENYGHIDFLLSVKAKEDVFDSMVSFFKSCGRSSSI